MGTRWYFMCFSTQMHQTKNLFRQGIYRPKYLVDWITKIPKNNAFKYTKDRFRILVNSIANAQAPLEPWSGWGFSKTFKKNFSQNFKYFDPHCALTNINLHFLDLSRLTCVILVYQAVTSSLQWRVRHKLEKY